MNVLPREKGGWMIRKYELWIFMLVVNSDCLTLITNICLHVYLDYLTTGPELQVNLDCYFHIKKLLWCVLFAWKMNEERKIGFHQWSLALVMQPQWQGSLEVDVQFLFLYSWLWVTFAKTWFFTSHAISSTILLLYSFKRRQSCRCLVVAMPRYLASLFIPNSIWRSPTTNDHFVP